MLLLTILIDSEFETSGGNDGPINDLFSLLWLLALLTVFAFADNLFGFILSTNLCDSNFDDSIDECFFRSAVEEWILLS